MSEFTTIEINGVKLEVDLRTARRIDAFKVGDRVKVLIKEYSEHKPYHGVIIGFDAFKEMPTITVAYLKKDYNGSQICFTYINKNSKDVELIADVNDKTELMYNRSDVIRQLDSAIEEANLKVKDLMNKKDLFLKTYSKHFEIE